MATCQAVVPPHSCPVSPALGATAGLEDLGTEAGAVKPSLSPSACGERLPFCGAAHTAHGPDALGPSPRCPGRGPAGAPPSLERGSRVPPWPFLAHSLAAQVSALEGLSGDRGDMPSARPGCVPVSYGTLSTTLFIPETLFPRWPACGSTTPTPQAVGFSKAGLRLLCSLSLTAAGTVPDTRLGTVARDWPAATGSLPSRRGEES